MINEIIVFLHVHTTNPDIMKREKSPDDSNRFHVLLAILSAFLIVYSMPKNRVERFSYTVGKPWTYEVLIAPFNFLIEKSDETWQAEADSVRRSFPSYFIRLSNVQNEALSAFDAYYSDSLFDVISRDSYIKLRKSLEQAYNSGIISVSDEDLVSGKEYMTIYDDNSSAIIPVRSVRTTREAYRLLIGSDILEIERNSLLSHNPERFIIPNLNYDGQRTTSEIEALQSQISYYLGMVVADQKIIDKGEIVNEEKDQIIQSYLAKVNEKTLSRRFLFLSWGGQSLFVVLVITLLFIYLRLYRKEIIEKRARLLFLYGSVTLFAVGVGLYVEYSSWNIFIIPCTMLAVMLRIFLDSRTAFVSYTVFVLATSLFVPMSYEYVVLQLLAGITGIYSLRELSQRSQIIRSGVLIFLTYCLIWGAVQMTRLEAMSDLDLKPFVFFAINCFLLLLVYPLLFVVEKVFGFTSNVTLIELSNFNNPLLRELAEKAPGTFQHSIQVSALAAEAATALHAGSQLVRTAALYHDIGKLANPPFFTENQGDVNPHDKLTPEESAQIITDHVREGVVLAEKHGLPQAVSEFITTHHGKGVARYFYIKYMEEHPDEEINIENFSYPGPNPGTKETAILMMADAVEAASRSLEEYTEESIGNLVDRIIDTQVEEGYFRESPLNWLDVQKIKEIFKDKLKIMYHTRIKYPESTVDLHRKRARLRS